MNLRDIEQVCDLNRQKASRAISLVQASLADFRPFDPNIEYSPKALEPYDALADRFVRAVECALRYFRSHELADFGEQSDTTRNLLNRMEKLGVISSTTLWQEMRNVRNRIVHDYLPEQQAAMFHEIQSRFGPKLLRLTPTLDARQG
jgi:uncharacterized protein with HEPN domain